MSSACAALLRGNAQQNPREWPVTSTAKPTKDSDRTRPYVCSALTSCKLRCLDARVFEGTTAVVMEKSASHEAVDSSTKESKLPASTERQISQYVMASYNAQHVDLRSSSSQCCGCLSSFSRSAERSRFHRLLPNGRAQAMLARPRTTRTECSRMRSHS